MFHVPDIYTIVWVCLSAMMWIYSKRHAVRKWQQTFILVVSSVLAVFTFSEKVRRSLNDDRNWENLLEELGKRTHCHNCYEIAVRLVYQHCYCVFLLQILLWSLQWELNAIKCIAFRNHPESESINGYPHHFIVEKKFFVTRKEFIDLWL